ncbi:family 16 glycosylhydrolase [Joostella atrarenae]|uniref:Family 16 glycosylhydrolase n=1 Tax=Joostella atrarenae TaxID=679257 RepID=A0ABS9J755_9FLAO|nr:family 16 glycosylhydrolase [Joostella atrarenae]MCF8716254.1 family 16 glycosylhydrolase [Joostella atrarenae]
MKLQILLYIYCLLQISSCDSNSTEEGDNLLPESEDEILEDPTVGYTLGDLEIPNSQGNPPIDMNWSLLNDFSDEFNYDGKSEEFSKKWNDTYFSSWVGPGLTEWTSQNSNIDGGNLILEGSRKPNTDKVYCGVISSKNKIKFPIYTEVRAKIANQVLSSNFWFLSEDDEREIDVLECYGSDRPDQSWFAARASSNTHVFIRDEETNAIIENFDDQTHHTLPNEEPWRKDFHRYGIYWKDAFNLDVFYDGVLVDQIRADDIKDPEGLGIDREMYMILDLEDHAWRSNQNPPIVATDNELENEDKNKYLVDYVRTYQPITEFNGGLIKNGSFNNPNLSDWYRKGPVSISTSSETNIDEAYTLKLETSGSVIQKIQVTPNTNYKLIWKYFSFGSGSEINVLGIAKSTLAATENWKNNSITFNSKSQNEIFIKVENTIDKPLFIDAFQLNKE